MKIKLHAASTGSHQQNRRQNLQTHRRYVWRAHGWHKAKVFTLGSWTEVGLTALMRWLTRDGADRRKDRWPSSDYRAVRSISCHQRSSARILKIRIHRSLDVHLFTAAGVMTPPGCWARTIWCVNQQYSTAQLCVLSAGYPGAYQAARCGSFYH